MFSQITLFHGICRKPTCSVTSVMSNCVTLWAVACHAPLSMGFFRQEYWSGFPVPPPGIFWPRDGTQISCTCCIGGGFFPAEPLRKHVESSPSLLLGILCFWTWHSLETFCHLQISAFSALMVIRGHFQRIRCSKLHNTHGFS